MPPSVDDILLQLLEDSATYAFTACWNCLRIPGDVRSSDCFTFACLCYMDFVVCNPVEFEDRLVLEVLDA